MELRETSFAEKIGQRITIILILIGAAVLIMLLLRSFGLLDPATLRAFVLSTGPWAPLVLMALIVIGTISLTFTSTPAIVLAGVLYGPVLGTLYSVIAVLIGASIAFFLARYFRAFIIRLVGSHAEILVRFQQKYVTSVVFVTRAIPVFSFEIISYASGLTSITYGAYIAATALGVIIPITLYTTAGTFILEAGGDVVPIILAATMILLVFIVPLLIDHYNPWGWKEKLLKAKHTKKAIH